MYRIAVSIIALSAVAAAPAFAQSSDARTVCARGVDERIIEIMSPGEVGERCDVRYARDGGTNVRTPYHANNSIDFCTEKAAELVAELRAAGFQCDDGAPALRGAGDAAPASDFVIETQRGAPSPAEPEAAAPVEAAPAEAAPEEPPAEEGDALQEEASLSEPVQETGQQAARQTSRQTTQQTPRQTVQPSQDDELAALMNEILSQPVSENLEQPVETVAVRGPANLTEGVSDAIVDAAPSAPVGRLVGADPLADEVREPLEETGRPATLEAALQEPVVQAPALEGAAPVTQAAVTEVPLEDISAPAGIEAPGPEVTASAAPAPAQTAAEAPTEPSRQVPAAAPRESSPQLVRQALVQNPPPVAATSGVPTLLRRPADIVRATVRAQAAAWNEGNLEAFMDVYAREDSLIYVSGDEVTRGWSAARKRYRDRYDGPTGMGRIDFEKLDAELVTEDVAIVTGRVRHAIGEEISNAVVSLVMKREEGVWRIVHDHKAPAITASQ